jgi:hypothetical protein
MTIIRNILDDNSELPIRFLLWYPPITKRDLFRLATVISQPLSEYLSVLLVKYTANLSAALRLSKLTCHGIEPRSAIPKSRRLTSSHLRYIKHIHLYLDMR